MRGPVNTTIRLTIMRKGADKPVEVTLARDVIRIRSVRSRVEGDDVGYIRITQFNEQTTEGLKKAIDRHHDADPADKLKGYRPRPAQQSGRPARPGDLGVRRVPRPGRDRLDPRPQCRRDPALQRPRRRPDRRQADDRADQRRLGLGVGNRRRRAAGPQARDRHRHALVRQGLGADHHPARLRQRRAAADHGALLHAVGPSIQAKGIEPDIEVLQDVPEELKARDRYQGRSLAARPSQGAKATRRPARSPTSRRIRRTTRRCTWPLDLLRGVVKNSAFPPNPKTPVPN